MQTIRNSSGGITYVYVILPIQYSHQLLESAHLGIGRYLI